MNQEINNYIETVLCQPMFKSEYSKKNCELLKVEPILEVNFFKNNSPLYILTGESATGKSYFVKKLRTLLEQEKKIVYHSGMVHRTGDYEKGFMEHLGSLVLEDMASTGENSLILFLKGLNFAPEKEHSIILDEPSLGLSEGYMSAASEIIKKYLTNSNKYLLGLFVCEHNKTILNELAKLAPNHLRFGDNKSLNQVINETEIFSIDDLSSLPNKSAVLRKNIAEIEREIKAYIKKH